MFGKKKNQKLLGKKEGLALVRQGKAKFIEDREDIMVVEMLPERKVEEVPIEQVPRKVPYEIIEQKDKRTVVVKRGTWSKGREFVSWRKRDYYANHILKETTSGPWAWSKTRVRFFIRWYRYSSEAIDAKGKVKYSPELENFLMLDMTFQFRDAAITLAGLSIDRTILTLLVLAMVFGIPIGLSYNDIFHWVPSTVVHWVTRQ